MATNGASSKLVTNRSANPLRGSKARSLLPVILAVLAGFAGFVGLVGLVGLVGFVGFVGLVGLPDMASSAQDGLESLASRQPNIVLIFADDLGYGDIGPYGSHGNPTPTLDRMASEGVAFTSFYASPLCSASRAQLLTGSYAPRVSVTAAYRASSFWGLHPAEKTIAEYLRDAGYATALVGKWHLGDQAETLPTRQGFQHYFGVPYANDSERPAGPGQPRVIPLMRDDRVIEQLVRSDQRQLTRRYTEESLRFIREQAAAERPFFLFLSHTAVHVPISPHPDFLGQSTNGQYGDWVVELDWSTGQIFELVRNLGIERRTLVLFISDNGPLLKRGIKLGSAGPLRGGKASTFEGGPRVPSLMWWPGKIPAGTKTHAVAGTTDLLPTLVKLAGSSLDAERKIDGYDIAPLMFGESHQSPHQAWYYFKGDTLKAVRSGRWKLALESQLDSASSKPADQSATGLRLYDLDSDIGERVDVAAQHPDVVAQLRSLAAPKVAEFGTHRRPGPGRRPAHYTPKPKKLWQIVPVGPKAANASEEAR